MTSARVLNIRGVGVYECAPQGSLVGREQDAVDLIGEAGAHDVEWIVLPVTRLAEGFFDLATRMAGGFLQKFVTYGFRVAIVGDITTFVAKSVALADFVRESNRGKHIWFLATMDAFSERLAS